MGECLIKRIGSAFDANEVTALESDVLSGKTFVKSDGEDGTGTMVNNGSPAYTLPINGSIVLPEGSYGGGSVSQNIPVFSGQTVNVGKNQVIVQTEGKYASGNIIIPAVSNLTPPNIRKGKYVGGVGPGTWEGYVNDDPNTPFYYGTFGPGYEAVTFKSYIESGNYVKGSAGIQKNRYYIATDDRYESIAVSLSKHIDFSEYSSLKYLADRYGSYGSLYFMLAQNKVESYLYSGDNASRKYNPQLGTVYYGAVTGFPTAPNYGSEATIDISSLNASGYLYFWLLGKQSTPKSFNIYYIKLE